MLRRIMLVLVVPALALALPLAVTAAGGADVATGNGTSVTCPGGVAPPFVDPRFCPISSRDFHFAAVSNLNAGEAHGVFRTRVFNRFTGETTATIRGRIFCVTAIANKAVIGVLATHVEPPGAPTGVVEGAAFYVPMVDNDGDVPDLYGPHYLEGSPPTDVEGQCTLDFVAFMTVTDGHVNVNDGQVSGNG